MSLSPISKQQLVSIIKNSIIAAVTAFVATIQVVGLGKAGAVAGLSAALAVVVKTIEKALTPA